MKVRGAVVLCPEPALFRRNPEQSREGSRRVPVWLRVSSFSLSRIAAESHLIGQVPRAILFAVSSDWEAGMTPSRRDFLASAIVGSLSLGLEGQGNQNKEPGSNKSESQPTSAKRPIMISAHNGYNYLDDAYSFLKNGGDTLDAALRVVKGPEDDPNDTSVGLGGLPNEEGVVELHACCMHGPTRRAGAVGGVRNIKNVSLVAKAVMEHTGHVMLVGEGAERFAVARGFPRENLLTDHSRKIWLLWKEYHSTSDWWGPGLADPHWQAPQEQPEGKPQSELWQQRFRRLEARAADLGIAPELRRDAVHKVLFPPTGTIHCSALNEKAEISGCTTTSGLAYKLPGRV